MVRTTSDLLECLSNAAATCLIPAAPPAPIGAHVQAVPDGQGDEIVEISLFYGATEVVGGPKDGIRSETPFWLDLASLGRAFDRIDSFSWQSARLGADDDLGPHVAVEGECEGVRVRLRVLAEAPRPFPAARTADARRGVFSDRW